MSLKLLVNNRTIWTSFEDYINARIQVEYNRLAVSTDMHDVYREQGKIQALKNLLYLRDEVNATQSG